MLTTQIAVRLPDRLLSELDDLVTRGVYESRAAAIRAGVEAIAESDRRSAIDRSIVDGYRRYPPTADEDAAALTSTLALIAEEPW